MNLTGEAPARMKSITIRKAGSVRLTSVAHPLYGSHGCNRAVGN